MTVNLNPLKKGWRWLRFRVLGSQDFSKTILQRQFKFKLSSLGKKYDIILDPFDHVANYHIAIHSKMHTTISFAKSFSISLERGARSWYNSFLPKSIFSFCQQHCKFTQQLTKRKSTKMRIA